MKTKLIVGTIITTVLATSVFAEGKYCDYSNKENKSGQDHYKMMNHHKGFKMQKIIQSLNLTPDQQTQIDILIKKHRDNKVNISDAFTKTDFDKQKFIQLATNKRENMIKSRANMIEGIYKILNDEQKLQLKVLMDVKMNQMHKMMSKGKSVDKHSYGRG